MSTGNRQDEFGSSVRLRGRPVDPAKRAAVLESAAKLFFRHGFAATSIEQVAAEAGVSKVTIYNQFGDKDALFAAAVDLECGKMRRMFEEGAKAVSAGREPASVRERLTAIGEAMSAFLSRPEVVGFDRQLAAESGRNPDVGRAFLNAGPYRVKAAFAAMLEAMVAAGDLRIEDCSLAAEQFVGMCKGLGDVERRYGMPTDPAADRARVAGAVELFLKGYSAR